ncbi:MAG TPA: SUMF1/EgtB/PvdO family nonheme iron enzyme [Saprospiraceae bacterium]|nr:SUMF1/EgtB/PvdO family nonheme iron enzyme [Saprospiraceae bacterium]
MSVPPIFISYRVKDTQIEARLLYVELANHFGRNAVFLDKKRIEPGMDWPTELETKVAGCQVLLILVRKGVVWAGHNEDNGEYRINDPKDWVRREIETSNQSGKEILPVFLDKAKFPAKSVLPEALHFLCTQQGKPIETENKWDDGVAALIKLLEDKGIRPQKTGAENPVTLLDDYPLPAGINPFKKYKEPYIGMRYFDHDAAPLFFGRTRELNAFFSLIERPETRLILVYGHSGVGKSSFLAAGVLPRLEHKVGDQNIHYERRDKTIQLGNQLQQLLEKPREAAQKRIFILDQVEEMFTDPVKNERSRMVDILEAALQNNPDDQFVLGFRSDYLTDVQSLLAEIRTGSEAVHLEPLDRSAIVEAIEGVKRSEEKNRFFQYHLDFDDDFARKAAADLIAKETAQVSTILQSRMQKLYLAAQERRAPGEPKVRLRWEDYEVLAKNAHAESELLDRAIEKVQQECSDAELHTIIETLDQFVINKETAGAKSKTDIENLESPLVQTLLHVNLLTELRAKQAIRLAHDVLAPVVRRRREELDRSEKDRLTAQNFDLLWQNIQRGLETLDYEAARQALSEAAQLQFYPQAYDLAPLAYELAYVFLWADKGTEGAALLRIFWDIQKQRGILFAPLPESSDPPRLRDYLAACDRDLFMHLENTYFPTMIQVQGGTFTMGSNDYDSEQPPHDVTLSDFAIAQTPTTWQQFGIFCLETGFKVPHDEDWGRANRPLINVSWEDAAEFCRWISTKRSRHYRLPTEAEWEYAARGGRLSKGCQYAGSDNLDEVGWYWENSGDERLSGEWGIDKINKNKCRTHPVGQKRSNELGLYDMSGNVWEWCEDDWHDDYKGAPKDGRAWVDSSRGDNRVYRGGGWSGDAEYCRAAFRRYWYPARRISDVGFRLVRS